MEQDIGGTLTFQIMTNHYKIKTVTLSQRAVLEMKLSDDNECID